MRHLRLLIIALATICVVALAAFALVNRPAPPPPGDDVIVIKGGSLEIQCGKNHGTDCLGSNDNMGKYKHKKDKAHVTNVLIRDVDHPDTIFFSSNFDKDHKPQIEITYKETAVAPK